MEDQSQSISPSPAISARQAITEKVWNLLVSAYTDNLSLNLDRFLRQNHLNRKRVEENLAEFGRSFESARFAAIIARRERKKALTRARNEKARADRLAERDAIRKQKAEQKQKEGWDAGPLPEGMFIQFYPGKNDAAQTYRGISVNFPDGTNLTLQECSAEGLSSLIDIYKRRKEAAACSL